MPPRLRKVALVTHVTCSVGWMIGAVAGFLALAGPLAVVDATIRAACVAMDLITGAVVVPLALASLLNRPRAGAGYRLGVLRHYWVLVKLDRSRSRVPQLMGT